MLTMKKAVSAAALASALLLGGCAYDDYGYGGMSVGYGSPYYDDYAYGPYGYSPYGWYDGYYYPGSGYWMYDRRGDRHRWSDRQRDYWERRRERGHGRWDGPTTQPWQPGMREERRRYGSREQRGVEQRNWRGNPGAQPQRQQQVREAPAVQGNVTRVPRPAPSSDQPRQRYRTRD